jgi:hypothetical protein
VDREIRLPVANIIITLRAGGGSVTSDLDVGVMVPDPLMSVMSSMPHPGPIAEAAFNSARQRLYEGLVADALGGVDVTAAAYLKWVRGVVEGLGASRHSGRRWGYP